MAHILITLLTNQLETRSIDPHILQPYPVNVFVNMNKVRGIVICYADQKLIYNRGMPLKERLFP